MVRAPRGGTTMEIDWADGHTSVYPLDYLRGWCPCAGCQGHGGEPHFVTGGSADLADIAESGNYALHLKWADGHETGIYTFEHLRAICGCPSCQPNGPPRDSPPVPAGRSEPARQ